MPMVLDALATPGTSALGTRWAVVTDRVMGGVSDGSLAVEVLDGERCYRLRGDVRTDNNGGFLQLALPLSGGGGTVDASAFAGVTLRVRGNGERYGVHLRTADSDAPWDSFRAEIEAGPAWSDVVLPWSAFVRAREREGVVDPRRLERIALVALGRAFQADVAMSYLALHR